MSNNHDLKGSLEPLLTWLKQHFNIHRFLWLLSVVIFIIAWNRGLVLLYGMFSLIVGVLCLSYIYPFLFLRNITVDRSQKTITSAGKHFEIEYKVKTDKQLYHIEICERLPFNDSPHYFKYFIPVISGKYTFKADVLCQRRGLFYLTDLSIQSSYPFGVFTHNKALEASRASVLVLPKTFRIQNLPLVFTSMQAKGGNIESTASGIHNEFSGLREYRHGDSMKHIHWASSARHQELIVKEYENFDRLGLLIVLDQHRDADIGELAESVFEYAVQICASIIEYAIENRIGVHVFGKGKTDTCFSAIPGTRDKHEYLKKLALIQSDGDVSYALTLNEALNKFDDINTVITFTNRTTYTNNEISDVIKDQVGHIDIDMVDESFIYPLRKYQLHKAYYRANRVTWSISRLSKLEDLFAC